MWSKHKVDDDQYNTNDNTSAKIHKISKIISIKITN